MTDAVKLSDQEFANLRRRARRKDAARGKRVRPHHADLVRDSASPAAPAPYSAIEMQCIQPNELDRLHRSLSEVTPENHPRTARLLASSTRKIAQKVIEEAGEVALEAVKHHPRGVVRESADLIYHLVALWHRAGIDPEEVWAEMRWRADILGIAEKRPKVGGNHRNPQRQVPARGG
jgi:phosphoribosyl-ATP pyrophosphohydrolase